MPGWAFDNIIHFVRKNIKSFEFYYDYTIYHPRLSTSVDIDFLANEKNQATASHFRKKIPFQDIPFVRGVFYRLQNVLNSLGYASFNGDGKKGYTRKDNCYDIVVYLDYYMDKDADFSHVKASKIIRGIYTASFPPKGIKIQENTTINQFCEEYLSDTSVLLCGSPSIVNMYKKTISCAALFANLAYDEKIFRPRKHNSTNKTFVLGWTGNPNREFKGFHSIILPAIEKLRQDYDIELKTQFEGTLESLADFWQGVDLAIIASEADAGPSMFMEASLCGVPSVSTKIGMPEYIIEDGVNGLFFDRSIEDLMDKLKLLLNNHQLLENLRSNIRQDYIDKLGFEVQKKNWDDLFQNVLVDEK